MFSLGVMIHALISRSLAKSPKGLCKVKGARLTKRYDDVPGFKLEIGIHPDENEPPSEFELS